MENEKDTREIEIEIAPAVDDDSAAEEEQSAAEEEQSAAGAIDDGDIQAELTHLNEEVERLREMYLRKLADFENYRKRQEREMEEYRRYATSELLTDCLEVIDNLERALEAPPEGSQALRTGVELVLRQFKDILGRHGVEEIDPRDEPFDPAVHEAIQRKESPSVEQNVVIDVLQKGYVLRDRLLRPAMVVVAVPATSAATGGEGTVD